MLDKKQGVVIALGYFDCVHLGHRRVINKAKTLAQQLNCQSAIFTFEGNLRSALGRGDEKFVYNVQERKSLFEKLGVSNVFFAPVTKEFLSLTAQEFLDFINQKYNVLGYVCGKDFRFGKGGLGDGEFLEKYAKANNQIVEIVDILTKNGLKVSTSLIKTLLSQGDMQSANALLDENYVVSGTVFEDRKVGSSLGFPTVNIKVDKDKQSLKNGVYYGGINIDGVDKKAVINYGTRPTFNLDNTLIEAHIIDFNGNLYGKTITLRFDGFLRDIEKFSSAEQLKCQLEKDVEKVRNTND